MTTSFKAWNEESSSPRRWDVHLQHEAFGVGIVAFEHQVQGGEEFLRAYGGEKAQAAQVHAQDGGVLQALVHQGAHRAQHGAVAAQDHDQAGLPGDGGKFAVRGVGGFP